MADLLNPANGPFPGDPLVLEGDPEPVTTDTLEMMPEAEFDDDLSDEETKEGEEDEVPPWESPVDPVDEFRLDSEQFVVEQQSVSWIKVLCAFLKDGAIPLDPFLRTQIVRMAPRYKVEEGGLKYRVNLPARAGHARTMYVTVVPPSYIETVLHFCHGDVMSAHLGVTKTLGRVRQQVFWPGWRKDVKEFVLIAVLVKGLARGDLDKCKGCPSAFSLVVVDAVGPLVLTERNNILVFADNFTRWAEAFAVKRLDTVTFVETLVNGVVSRHGIPSRLLSNRGSNFISDLVKSFYEAHQETVWICLSSSNPGPRRTLKKIGTSIFPVYYSPIGRSTMRLLEISLSSLYMADPVLPLDVAFLNLGEKWKSNEVDQYRRELHKSLRDARH
ncbi:Gag-pol Polyprotein, partial [Phytophthora megakarya]